MRISRTFKPVLLSLVAIVGAGVAVAQDKDSSPKAPRAAAFSETPQTKLGTLPEGIGLAVGQKAPDAKVSDAEGRPVQLQELVKRGPVLLVFYRGGWCPYCNFQIRELAQAHGEFQKRGITPVAISVDRIEEAAKTRASWQVPFPVLSDPDLVAHEAFRMVHQTDVVERTKLKAYGIDLEASSGRKHHRFAVPGLFLIDREGTVRWAHADTEYKVRPKIPQLLSALDGVKLATQP